MDDDDDDRISSLPDEILRSILSSLPTKLVVSTSLLSKRWQHLWRSVPALDFECHRTISDFAFLRSVYAFICFRNFHETLKRFRLICHSSFGDPANCSNVNSWINAALQRRVQHIDLCIPWTLELPSACKTLVVLNLTKLSIPNASQFDFPSLKTLSLAFVSFVEPAGFANLLCGCPNLEDLNVKICRDKGYVKFDEIKAKFQRLPRLVRTHIKAVTLPLQVVDNVQFLRIDWMPKMRLICQHAEFHNLNRIEFGCGERSNDWCRVLEVLEHCHNLQILVIDKVNNSRSFSVDKGNWQYPKSVPMCISFHLKTCRFRNYRGSQGEFQFARYIMQNARRLQAMTIFIDTKSDQEDNGKIKEELSLCEKGSASCELLFK